MDKKRKHFLIIALLITVVGIVAFFVLTKVNEKVADVKAAKVERSLTCNNAFELEDSEIKSSIDKAIQIEGTLQSISKDGEETTLVLSEDGINSVICQMDNRHVNGLNQISEGQHVTLVGMLTGCESDDLLGSTIQLKNCILK